MFAHCWKKGADLFYTVYLFTEINLSPFTCPHLQAPPPLGSETAQREICNA